MRGLGLRCAMVVPLTARGRTFGALTLIGAETHARYDSADLQLAEEIADRAALAIDTARSFAAESEARAAAVELARRNEVLKDVTAAFGRAASVPEVLTAMLELGVRTAGAAGATVGIVEDGGRVDVAGLSGYEPDDRPYWNTFALSDPLPMSDAIRDRQPGRPVDHRGARSPATRPCGAGESSATTRSCACRCCSATSRSAPSPPPTPRGPTSVPRTCPSCARSASSARRRSTGRGRASGRRERGCGSTRSPPPHARSR